MPTSQSVATPIMIVIFPMNGIATAINSKIAITEANAQITQ
jgi:hypothetical protein